MSNALNIVFMGTPDFAVPVLDALIESHHNVIGVYTQPPRAKGRGNKVQKSPVHERADKQSIPVFHPTSFKNKDAQEQFKSLNADVAIVAAYGMLLPKPALDTPKHGCINVHVSLLPRWRGASPIQQAIWRGDTETGVTIMHMGIGMDTGDIITQQSIPITDTTTSSELYDVLFKMGGALTVTVLDNIDTITSTPQDDSLATPAPMLTKEDGRIDWSSTATEINRQIRALTPWPGTYCINGAKRLKIMAASVSDAVSDAKPGTILDRGGSVVCGGSTLKLITVQPEGSKTMDAVSAINGGYLKIGDVLQ